MGKTHQHSMNTQVPHLRTHSISGDMTLSVYSNLYHINYKSFSPDTLTGDLSTNQDLIPKDAIMNQLVNITASPKTKKITKMEKSQLPPTIVTSLPLPSDHSPTSWMEVTLQGHGLAYNFTLKNQPVKLIVQIRHIWRGKWWKP